MLQIFYIHMNKRCYRYFTYTLAKDATDLILVHCCYALHGLFLRSYLDLAANVRNFYLIACSVNGLGVYKLLFLFSCNPK